MHDTDAQISETKEVSNATSSLTVAQFEQGKSVIQRRVSFQELGDILQFDTRVPEIINTNLVLSTLNINRLLFFSTENRESTLNYLKNHKYNKDILSHDIALNTIIFNSLDTLNKDYMECMQLGKDFLNTSTQVLAMQNKSSGFGGLSIESIPYFDGNIRIDGYAFDPKQLRICFQPMKAPLRASNRPSLLLAHELTHAIDDVQNLNSCKVLFNTLHNKAHNDAKKQELILDCAAKILDHDDNHQMFTNQYLPSLKKKWFKKKNKNNFVYDWANHWVEKMNKASAQQNVFEDFDDQGNRGLKCGSVPTEFLTFSTEHVFNALKQSDNVTQFTNNYQNTIRSQLSSCDNFAPEIKKAAFELIKDTTNPHLTLLMDHSSSEELTASLGSAIYILQKACDTLTQPVAALSTTITNEVDDTHSSRKRSSSPLQGQNNEEKDEKKPNIENNRSTTDSPIPQLNTSNTTSLTTDHYSARKSIPSTQEHLYSKDDSRIDEMVSRMKERFSPTKATNSTTPTTPTTKTMPERRRSYSI